MVTNYYNSSNNFKAPVRREPKPFIPHPEQNISTESNCCDKPQKAKPEIDTDVVLILGLILLLIMSGCDDTLLLIALGYLILF